MSRKHLEVEGAWYKVVESYGFVHDIGKWAYLVSTDTGNRVAVGRGSNFRFRDNAEKVDPLLCKAIEESEK